MRILTGKPHGWGSRVCPDGCSVYEGQWWNGQRYGKGRLIWADGTVYEGDFMGRRSGKGTLISPQGDKYTGDWKDSEMHGEGVYKWANGKRYEGKFENDEMTGEGILTYAPTEKSLTSNSEE